MPDQSAPARLSIRGKAKKVNWISTKYIHETLLALEPITVRTFP